MIWIKAIIHLLTIIAYAIIAIKSYEKLVNLKIRKLDKCSLKKMPFNLKLSCTIGNRYFLGNLFLFLATAGAFFLLISDLFNVMSIENGLKWNINHLVLLTGIYLIRGFKFEFHLIDKLRVQVLRLFILLVKLLPIVFILFFTSCKTAQQKADRHIQKAIALDPEVIKRVKTNVLIQDSIIFKKTIELPSINYDRSINFDVFLSDLKRDSLISIIDTLNTKLTARMKENNQIIFDFNHTPEPIQIDTVIIYKKEHEVDGAQIQVRVREPIWRYFIFWLLCVYSFYITYLALFKTRK